MKTAIFGLIIFFAIVLGFAAIITDVDAKSRTQPPMRYFNLEYKRDYSKNFFSRPNVGTKKFYYYFGATNKFFKNSNSLYLRNLFLLRRK